MEGEREVEGGGERKIGRQEKEIYAASVGK